MIIAFDGTTNGAEDITNTFKLFDLYKSRHKLYITGIGSRGMFLSKLLESAFGIGGKERLESAMKVYEYWKNDSRETIIVGFSRGAVMAREFCNMLADKKQNVDLLILFDSVGSFGINPFNLVNIGYRTDIPVTVRDCIHIMAYDENRRAFKLIRLKLHEGNTRTSFSETWAQGDHSRIGNGEQSLKRALFLASRITNQFGKTEEKWGYSLSLSLSRLSKTEGRKINKKRIKSRKLRYEDRVLKKNIY